MGALLDARTVKPRLFRGAGTCVYVLERDSRHVNWLTVTPMMLHEPWEHWVHDTITIVKLSTTELPEL